MTPVVKTVARAMCVQGGFDPDQIMANEGPRWRYYVPGACAAIAALSPPSDAMAAAAANAYANSKNPDIFGAFAEVISAALAAAIKDGGG